MNGNTRGIGYTQTHKRKEILLLQAIAKTDNGHTSLVVARCPLDRLFRTSAYTIPNCRDVFAVTCSPPTPGYAEDAGDFRTPAINTTHHHQHKSYAWCCCICSPPKNLFSPVEGFLEKATPVPQPSFMFPYAIA